MKPRHTQLPKGFFNKLALATRHGLAEGFKFQALQVKAAGLVFNAAGAYIPFVGALKGKALGMLCDKVGDGFDSLIDRLEGGYRLEGVPDMMGFLNAKIDHVRGLLKPGHADLAAAKINAAGGLLNRVSPALNLPPLKPRP